MDDEKYRIHVRVRLWPCPNPLLVLRALVCVATGEADGGLADVAEALAGPKGNLHVFLEGGPPIARLRHRLPAGPDCDLALSVVARADAAGPP